LLTADRKFFSTPAGYKPPPESKPTKTKDKEDVEMSICILSKTGLTTADAKDDENGETVSEDANSKAEVTPGTPKPKLPLMLKTRMESRLLRPNQQRRKDASSKTILRRMKSHPQPFPPHRNRNPLLKHPANPHLPNPSKSPKHHLKRPMKKPPPQTLTPPSPLRKKNPTSTPKPKPNPAKNCPPPPPLSIQNLTSRLNWTPSKTSWAPGTPVPYSALCATFDTISSTTKRLEILSHLTKFYRTVIEITPDNLLQTVYLTINRIAPDYEGVELGIGESLLVKAIAESSGRSVQQVKNELEKTGDLGDIAQVNISPSNTPILP
jgi:hypothetical protein